jgi:hypothetical protein
MWQQWSQSKEDWQHSIAIIAIQSFYLGMWAVIAISCYIYWRSEKWRHAVNTPSNPTKNKM